MEQDHRNIIPLIIKDINGNITAEEKALLEQRLSTDAEARHLFEDMHNELGTPQAQILIKGLPERLPASMMRQRAARQKRMAYLKRVTAVAASIAAMGCIIWLLNSPLKRGMRKDLLVKNNHSVQLQLGQTTIDLSGDQQQVVGGVQVRSLKKVLTLQVREQAAGNAVLTVPTGEFYQLHFSDGSQAYVNSATTINFPTRFSGLAREITIDGEAYVIVAKDAVHPFIVHLPRGQVRVLGTEFNVNTYDSSQVQIALVSGGLKINSTADSVLLKPGYVACYGIKENKMNVQAYDPRILSWTKGVYYYYNSTLSSLCQVVNRWYGVEMVLDAPASTSHRITGTLHRNEPVDSFLTNITTTTGLEFYKKDGVIHLK